MKPFLRKLFMVLALQGLVAAVLWQRYRFDSHSYMAASIDKHARLLRLSSPRLILVGGSNVALGLSARVLSKALAMPAVNMGLHADLSRDFMLAEVHDQLRAGDVVVLSFEYQLFGEAPNPLALMQLLELRPASLRYVPARLLPRFSDDGLILVGERCRRALGVVVEARPPYSRESFDVYGDGVAHFGLAQRLPLARFDMRGVDDSGIARGVRGLSSFVAHARSQGARVYYTFPPIPRRDLAHHRKLIHTIAARVRAVAGMVVVDAPTGLPQRCFFDTAYHLTRVCTERRSAGLAARMQSVRTGQ